MKTLHAAALAAAMLFTLSQASAALAADAPKAATKTAAKGPVATIHDMEDSFNKGDEAAFNAHYVDGPVIIIDEFGQHLWTGKTAPDDWYKALVAANTANKDADGVMTLGATVKQQVDGASAYVVVSANYAFTEAGKKMHEPGLFTFVLDKVGGAWKVKAWTWSGHKAVAEVAAKSPS